MVDSWWAGLAGAAWSACLVASRQLMVGLLVGGRHGQLLSDDAAEGQESTMAVGLREHLPEAGQRDMPGRLQWARGGLDWRVDVA